MQYWDWRPSDDRGRAPCAAPGVCTSRVQRRGRVARHTKIQEAGRATELPPDFTLSRRSLVRAGAATAVALGSGALLAGTAAAAEELPASPYIDITKPSHDLFRSKMLHESHHVMQGFAFDNVNRRLFIVQAQNGTSGDDLCVSQLGFSGELLGSMHLNHAGHGVSLGVEPVGTASYIWMECDADGTTTESRGTALARFKFVDGGTRR